MNVTIPRRTAFAAMLAAPAIVAARRPTAAQTPGWAPTRPIRIIVPFAPGQANDIFARLLAEKAGELRWPQQRVIVENRAGAGGAIGMQAAAGAPPDGHTLAFGSLATFAINPAVMRNLPYDVERDFVPVVRVFEGSLVLVVPARSGPADVPGLVARLRGQQGLNYASSGPGSTQHMTAELFLQGLGVRATHVPYRGSGPAMTDLASGAVDFAFESLAAAMPLVQSGLLRPLAVTAPARLPALPDLPTVAEAAGLANFSSRGTGGLLAPARTPAPAVKALFEGFAAALVDPALVQRVTEANLPPIAEGPEPFGAFIRAELAKWREVARRGEIVLD
jgi:tripartite-type tricarboxylate transporter receptor subunit TctC